jgi:hypothetical protein
MCTALLRVFYLATATSAIMLSQNYFPHRNRHLLDLLHPIVLCRITYRAPLVDDLSTQKCMDFGMMMMTFEKSVVCVYLGFDFHVCLLLKIAPAILVPWDVDNFLRSS